MNPTNTPSNGNPAKRPIELDALLITCVQASEKGMRKHGEVPACFFAVESCGLYIFGFERGEIFGEFLENVLLLCRARDLDAGILTISAGRGKSIDPKLSMRELHRLTTHVAFVAENRQGQRIERILPIIRDDAANFKSFGEYNAEHSNPLGLKFPRLMPTCPPTAPERMAARAALTQRGILVKHEMLDAAKVNSRPAAPKSMGRIRQ
jgi:hypothetical protein